MKHAAEKIFIGAFALFLVLIPILSFIFPEKEFSIFEYRFMAAVPEYRAERLLDAEYYSEWETYFKDRIFFRTNLLKAYTKANIHLLKKPVVNDVVINDGILLGFNGIDGGNLNGVDEKIDIMKNNIGRLDALCRDIGAKLYVVGIPEQSSMLSGAYPDYLEDNRRKEYIEERFFSAVSDLGVESINMKQVFEEKDFAKLYSKTDHHYNYFGAFETYRAIAERIVQSSGFNITPLEYEDMDFKSIDLPFYGSRSRKLFGEFSDVEKLCIGYPKEKVEYVRFDEGKASEATVFDMPRENYSTYNVYMGGDKAETIIKTDRKELPDVLLIGDSFTNPLETILYYNCNEFRSLDFRYYLSKSITDYLKEDYRPDIVIFLRDDGNYLNVEGNGNMNFYMDNEKNTGN